MVYSLPTRWNSSRTIDAPVRPDIGGDVLRSGLAGGEAGDQVHGLAGRLRDELPGAAVAFPVPDGAHAADFGNLFHVRDQGLYLLGGVHDEASAGFLASVALVRGGVAGGAGPAQGVERGVEVLAVHLYREHEVRTEFFPGKYRE